MCVPAIATGRLPWFPRFSQSFFFLFCELCLLPTPRRSLGLVSARGSGGMMWLSTRWFCVAILKHLQRFLSSSLLLTKFPRSTAAFRSCRRSPLSFLRFVTPVGRIRLGLCVLLSRRVKEGGTCVSTECLVVQTAEICGHEVGTEMPDEQGRCRF